MSFTLADFDYDLPPELIAQAPLPQRSASRLLVVGGQDCSDSFMTDLPLHLRPGDLLVVNDSRVLHARLLGRKASGGQVEVLVERVLPDNEVLAQVRASKSPRAGSRLLLENVIDVEVLGRTGEFYRLRFAGNALELIEQHGRLPLPPYVERPAADADETRYQTVFARNKGSVAAPTAGLHFDAALLAAVRERGVEVAYVTLHVGAGTFQPVRVDDLSQHRMHTESYVVPAETAAAIAAARLRGGRVIAIGTTSLRALESAASDSGIKVGAGETAIFITPGFRFRVADALLTNFHLPRSTLLMLISAFAGYEEIRAAYRHAIAARYRFFSYGDAMLLTRKEAP
ncbi:MAG: tRNA preQ1(34) S-adenosylmethionine ribosyltransferase-isomerase QueA [Rugosibacter sp.]|nr:tRNA preQ1(34) S-adenosylmethionine ribosyltransferase-isomerase QueA [Rugosibacter sp.]